MRIKTGVGFSGGRGGGKVAELVCIVDWGDGGERRVMD
jgi:hypothetical protein